METFSDHYSSLYQTLNKYMPNANVELIESAIRYAEEKHKDQKRKDGSPYIIHPLAVAEVVLEMGLDVDAVLGALLHDCIELVDVRRPEEDAREPALRDAVEIPLRRLALDLFRIVVLAEMGTHDMFEDIALLRRREPAGFTLAE